MDHQENPSNPPPVETEEQEEELLPIVRIMTWMMDGLEERLKKELRAYVKEFLVQECIEELLKRRRS